MYRDVQRHRMVLPAIARLWSSLSRVERGVEAQVQETTLDGHRQRQPCQHHQLLVPGSCHRRCRYESLGECQ